MIKTCVTAAGLYCGLGMTVPIAPTVVGFLGVLFTRMLLWSKKDTILWNLTVVALALLATFVTLEGDESSTLMGFWIGVGFGSLGQGILNMGKSAFMSTFKDRLSKAMEVFMGTKEPPAPPTPPAE